MPFETITSIAVAQRIAERRRDLIGSGTFTAATSTTATDAGELSFDDADALKGAWVYTIAGMGLGQERRISSSSTVGVITVPTWTVTPNSTTTYMVTRTRRPTEYKRMVLGGLRASRRAQLSYITRAIGMTGAQPFVDGLMSHWDDDNTLTGWTVSGSGADSVTRERYNKITGESAALWIIDDTTEGTFYTKAANTWLKGLNHDEVVTVKAVIQGVGARFQAASTAPIWTGVTDFTVDSYDAVDGDGWQVMEASVRVTDPNGVGSTGMIGLKMDSSGAGVAQILVDLIYIPTENNQRRYQLPADFVIIDEIRIADHAPGTSGDSISDEIPSSPWDEWHPVRGLPAAEGVTWLPSAEMSNTAIEFDKLPPKERVIWVSGLGVNANMREGQLADSENVYINAEILVEYGKWRMDQDQDAAGNFFRMLDGTRIPYPENSIQLENL